MPSIGVSFYVFQAISYLADVYLEKIEAEKHFGYLALYLSFFPKLLQGPIERGASLLPQLHTQYKFDYETAKNGLVLFAWGLFKKVAIADRLAVFVNFVYETPKEFSGPVLILATVLFAFQIYYDFSGYTDMALGIARLFNIRLTQNFRTPYFSYSIADFWRRWHITFSGWLQDYLFIPFQIIFRGMGSAGTAISLLITFFICGLWHGANWTFIIWGILNGIYLSLYFLTKNLRAKAGRFFMLGKAPRLTTVLQVVTTFIFVCFSWIFFRANCIDNALYIVTHIFSGFGTLFDAVIRHRIDSIRMAISFGGSRFSRFDIYALLISLFLYFICELSQAKMGNKEIGQYLSEKSSFTRWAVYYMLIFGIIFWGALGSSIQPIYFQF